MVIAVPFGATLPLKHTQNITLPIGRDILIPVTYNLLIECPIARGNPSPFISWLLEDSIIPGRHPQYTMLNDGTLLINNLTRDRDEGVYTCIADSLEVGQDNSSSTITVTGINLAFVSQFEF